MICPLCRAHEPRILWTLPTACVVSVWREAFGCDVARYFAGAPDLVSLRCRACELGFYDPAVTGDSALYEQLGQTQRYYGGDKWEYGQAMRDTGRTGRLLEIGCGSGEFLMRVRGHVTSAEGIEINGEAVRAACDRGLLVREARFEDLAAEPSSAYDAICAFQVLEHLPDPAAALQTVCRLLRPDGMFAVGLPNAGGYLGWGFRALEAPPHHVTRWCAATVHRLKRFFPLDPIRVALEPLPRDCIERWVDGYTDRFADRLYAQRPTWPGLRWFLTRALDRSGAYRLLRGQTLYAAFKRR